MRVIVSRIVVVGMIAWLVYNCLFPDKSTGLIYNRSTTRELRLWLAAARWWLKLSTYMLVTSFCLGMQAVLFFILQDAWKVWAEGQIQQRELVILTASVVLFHLPFLASVLWFTRAVHRLWDGLGKG